MKQRLFFLDNLKGFAILLVVLGHCIQFSTANYTDNLLFHLIYSFHMPLFFVVSGFVSYKEQFSLTRNVGRRAYQLLVPYFLVGGVKIVINHLNPIDLLLDVNNFLWFLWTLFFINLVVMGILTLARGSRIATAALLLVSVLVMGASKALDIDAFGLKLICLNMQYFVAGVLMRIWRVDEHIRSWHLCLTVPLFCIFFIMKECLFPDVSASKGLALLALSMLMAYTASYTFFLLFKNYYNTSSLLSRIGMCTLGIYAVHFFVIDAFLTFQMPVWLLFVVVSLLSLCLVWLIRRSVFLRPFIGEYIIIRKS